MEKPIAICKNDKIFKHSGNWNIQFIRYCEEKGISYEVLNCYDSEIINKIDAFSALVWPIQNYVISDMLESRTILRIAEEKGLNVFPNIKTSWHFDDKVAEMYLFQSLGAPIPKSWIFYTLEDSLSFLNNKSYPIIAKLRTGSGSNNVKLLKNKRESFKYSKRMFSKGYDASPSLLYKAYSKAQSSRSMKIALGRIKKIPEFLNTKRHANKLPIEKGYTYFQELIPNDGYDIKVVVVGDKLSYFVRKVRKGDFRASGGGDFFYDKKYITKEIIDIAFNISNRAGLQCVGFDFVVDNMTNSPLIIEMCYGFDWEAILAAEGYWTSDGEWHDKPLNVPNEIIKNLI